MMATKELSNKEKKIVWQSVESRWGLFRWRSQQLGWIAALPADALNDKRDYNTVLRGSHLL